MWETRIAILKCLINNECRKAIEMIKHIPNHTGENILGDYSIKINYILLLGKLLSHFL